VGHLTEPGRYLFTFGWLTVSAQDIAVWERFPHAAFTLVKTAKLADDPEADGAGEEFHLGAFELRESSDAASS
jgi:hypothetical protein